MILKHHHTVLLQQIQQPVRGQSEDLKKVFSSCKRFNDQEYNQDYQNALVFLKLLDEKCPKDQAAQFCKRRLCKVDSTAQQYGPSRHRTLKLDKDEKIITNNNGWCSPTQIKYQMGEDYVSSTVKAIIREDESNKKMENQFRQNEALMKSDFKGSINNLKNFLNEINNKYDLTYSSLGKTGLKKKLRDLSLKNTQERKKPLKYIKYLGQKYFEVVDEYESQQNYQNGSLTKLNPFDPAVKFPKRKFLQKEKLPDRVFSHLGNPTPSMGSDGYQQNDIYQKLEEESNFVLKLLGVSESMGKQKRSNKKEVEAIKQQNADLAKRKHSVAQEYNRSQYFFNVGETPSSKNIKLHFNPNESQLTITSNQSPKQSITRKFIRQQMDSLDTPMLSKKMSGFGSAFGESSPTKSFGSNRISLLKYQKKCSIDLLDQEQFQEQFKEDIMDNASFDTKLERFVKNNLDQNNIRPHQQKSRTEFDYSEIRSIKQRHDDAVQKLLNKVQKCSSSKILKRMV